MLSLTFMDIIIDLFRRVVYGIGTFFLHYRSRKNERNYLSWG